MKTTFLKITLVALFAAVAFIAPAQTYQFAPKWKVGEKKSIRYETTESTHEDGILVSDSTYYNEGTIEVIAEDDSSYTIKAIFENQAMRATQNFYDKIGEELSDYRNIEMRFTVDKITAETDLLNWEETQEFVLDSFDKIEGVLEEKAPEAGVLVDLVFLPLKQSFNSKENIDAYAKDYLKAVFAPYNKSFELNVPLSIEHSGENPMNPSMELKLTETFTLKEVNQKAGTCVLSHSVDFDFSQLLALMKDMMEGMAEAFEMDEEAKAKQEKEIDELEMNMSSEEIITYNSKSSWVEKTTGTSTAVSTDPRSGVKSTVVVQTITTIQ